MLQHGKGPGAKTLIRHQCFYSIYEEWHTDNSKLNMVRGSPAASCTQKGAGGYG